MTNWFLLVSLYVAMYFFNVGVATTQAVKTVVNVVAIIAAAILALFASGTV